MKWRNMLDTLPSLDEFGMEFDSKSQDRFNFPSINKEREVLKNQKKHPIWIRLVIVVVITAVLAMIYLTGSHGYLAIIKLQTENQEISQKIDQLEADNQELQQKLAHDGKYTSEEYIRTAREILGWVLPGERVYRFISPPKDNTKDKTQ